MRTVPPVATLFAILVSAHVAHADPPTSAGARRVDGIAALVGGTAPGTGVETILRSDVELVASLSLGPDAQSGAALAPDLLRTTLERIVGETLIAREAERVRVPAPTAADVAQERSRIEQSAGGQARSRALLLALDAGAAELDAVARRRATVAAFLRANLEGTTIVSDAEVEQVYASGQHPLTDQSLEQARESLRALLARRALDRAVARWVGVLRARTTVRILVTFER